jgi:5-methyltetrahydropteroyltriglutamate--homocysteine methyltransferase
MLTSKGPFRADMVGSLLRSAALKDAREKREAGKIGPVELTAIEDAEIKKLVSKQESIGLTAITDG